MNRPPGPAPSRAERLRARIPRLGLRGRVALAVWVATAGSLALAGQFSTSYLYRSEGPDPVGLQMALRVLGVAGGALAGLAAWLVAGAIARPVRRAGEVARRLGEGDLDARIRAYGNDDIAQMSRQFNAMADSLNQMMDAQRNFISDTAHELRTPTAALVAAASALENPETRDEAATIVAPQLRRLSELTEDLLALARFDSSREVLRTEPTDLVGLCHAAVRGLGEPGDVRVVGGAGLVLPLDAVRVQTIVRNLVVNGLKHGQAPVTVLVQARDRGASVTVVDEGPGVDHELGEALFERFVRGDQARHGEGSGLGLAIARENARLHGGELELDESGQAFRLWLPDEPFTQPVAVEPPRTRPWALRWVLAVLLVGTGAGLEVMITAVRPELRGRLIRPWGLWDAVGFEALAVLAALVMWLVLRLGVRLSGRWEVAVPIAVLLVAVALGLGTTLHIWLVLWLVVPVVILLLVDRWL